MSIGLYIHIPFCASKCNYCDFLSHKATDEETDIYVDALCKEISLYKCKETVDTVYFGGGTPTYLKPEKLTRILDTVYKNYSVSENREITTECNPKTIDREGFETLFKAGFNRLSIGMQSADNEILRILGRIHNFDDVKKSVDCATAAGFENISLDLMFGLPKQDLSVWKNTLKEAVSLNPAHLSCYSLKIEDGTPFAKMNLEIDDDLMRSMYDEGVSFLEEKGYNLYEISNFAKPGYESKHNIKYWQCDEYRGFGVGAYSFTHNKRYSNITDVFEYAEKIKNSESVTAEFESIDITDSMSEFMFLGLRMTEGVSEEEFKKRFKTDVYSVYKEQIDKNLKRGTLVRENGQIKIPKEFLFVSNSVLVDFVN